MLDKKLSDSFEGMAKKIACLLPDIMKRMVPDGKIVRSMEWIPMGKSIANLYRYVEFSRSITKRYLTAMPDISMGKAAKK